MHLKLEGKEHYARPKYGKDRIGKDLGDELSKLQFVVTHYAGQVQYTAHNWLEKNRGRLNADLAAVLGASNSEALGPLFSAESEERRPTVGGAFRASLRALSATLLETTQHFIRCIKPNGEQKADAFNGRFISRQLRYTRRRRHVT
jgi:myosin heavy subunit